MRQGTQRAGIRGIRRNEEMQRAQEALGSQIAETEVANMTAQLTSFKENLEEFASKHRNDIRKNPVFRMKFQQMCSKIGVDPLSSNKGFWSEILGVGDFYFELAVQILDVCYRTRAHNGGLISFNELHEALRKSRGAHAQPIQMDDIDRAVRKLGILGSLSIITLPDKTKMLRSVPCDLTPDTSMLITAAADSGYVTATAVKSQLKWDSERFEATLNLLMKEGMVWVDEQTSPIQYWFPCYFYQ